MSKCYSHDDTGCYSMVGPSRVECTINGNCWGTSDACCPELKKNTGCKSVPGSDSCSCKCYENGDAEPCNNITKCAATCSNWGSKNCVASNNINNNVKKLGDNSSQNTGLSGAAILAIVIGSMIVVLLALGFFMKGSSSTKKRTRFKNH